MYPIIFHIGNDNVSSFFFMIMVGALVTTFYAAHTAKRFGEHPVVMIDLGIITTIMAIIGARIFHILVEYPMYYWEKTIRIFYFWQGGFVSIGAVLVSAVKNPDR